MHVGSFIDLVPLGILKHGELRGTKPTPAEVKGAVFEILKNSNSRNCPQNEKNINLIIAHNIKRRY